MLYLFMDKIIFIIISLVVLVVCVFFREQTGIGAKSIVVFILALFFGFTRIFLKKWIKY